MSKAPFSIILALFFLFLITIHCQVQSNSPTQLKSILNNKHNIENKTPEKPLRTLIEEVNPSLQSEINDKTDKPHHFRILTGACPANISSYYRYDNSSCQPTCNAPFRYATYNGDNYCYFPCSFTQWYYQDNTCKDTCDPSFRRVEYNYFHYCETKSTSPAPSSPSSSESSSSGAAALPLGTSLIIVVIIVPICGIAGAIMFFVWRHRKALRLAKQVKPLKNQPDQGLDDMEKYNVDKYKGFELERDPELDDEGDAPKENVQQSGDKLRSNNRNKDKKKGPTVNKIEIW